MLRTFFSITFLLAFFVLKSQTYQFKVVDAYNNQPIPNAHICAELKDRTQEFFWATDVKGIKENDLKKEAKIAVTFIGYKSYIGYVQPGKSYKIKLIPKSEEINEVVITGQFKPEAVDKSIYNVQVIDKLSIQNKAANNLSDLLSNELNLKVENNGVLGTSISMQGLSGEHIKILIDGVPVVGRQNGNVDLNQLNLQNIDHIEIIEGPMSVIYGSNALGGAINLISKKNTRPKFSAGTNLFYESVGNYNADIFYTKNINENYFNVTAGRNFFDGFYPSGNIRNSSPLTDNNENQNDFDPKEQYFTTFDYGYNGNRIKINLKQDFFKEQVRNLGPITSYPIEANDTTDTYYFNARDEYHYTTRANSKFDAIYNFNDSCFVSFIAAYGYYNKTKNTKQKLFATGESVIIADTAANDTSLFPAYTSRGVLTKIYKNIELSTGYDANIETGKGKRIKETKRIDDIGLFLNLKYMPLENLSVQTGGRFIYNSKYEAPIIYSLNLKYDPIKNLNLRASIGTGFRSPSLKELYLSFVDINHNVNGNPNLSPEYSRNINFSASYLTELKKQSLNYSFKFYHTQLKNKIDFLFYENDLSKADYTNLNGWYKTIGSQFDITYKFHPRLKLTTGINYYGNSKLSDLDKYIFTNDYIASLNYSNVKYNFKVNIYFKHNGEEKQFINKGTSNEPEIEENFRDGYNMLDFSVNKPFFNDKVNFGLGVKNILDVTSVSAYGSGGAHSGGSGSSSITWGRTFFIDFKYTFTKF